MASAFIVFLNQIIDPVRELFKRGRPRKELQDFAVVKGFEYKEQVDPVELGLCDTQFFGRFDVARDVIIGDIDNVRFIYFEHDRASGRGGNAVVRSVVVFEIAAEIQGLGSHYAGDGWSFEKSGTHLFLWLWNDKEPKRVEEIEEFLFQALRVSQRLASYCERA